MVARPELEKDRKNDPFEAGRRRFLGHQKVTSLIRSEIIEGLIELVKARRMSHAELVTDENWCRRSSASGFGKAKKGQNLGSFCHPFAAHEQAHQTTIA